MPENQREREEGISLSNPQVLCPDNIICNDDAELCVWPHTVDFQITLSKHGASKAPSSHPADPISTPNIPPKNRKRNTRSGGISSVLSKSKFSNRRRSLRTPHSWRASHYPRSHRLNPAFVNPSPNLLRRARRIHPQGVQQRSFDAATDRGTLGYSVVNDGAATDPLGQVVVVFTV